MEKDRFNLFFLFLFIFIIVSALKATSRERKYKATDPALLKNARIRHFFEKWNDIEPPSDPPRWPLNTERWASLLNDYCSSDKGSFLDQIENGMILTENENIHCDQGQKSYNLTIKEWIFACEQIDEYMQKDKNCVWGAFSPWDLMENHEFLDHIVMPHFIAHKIKEDGSEKLRLVTDATHTVDGGRSFNDNIFKEEKNVSYLNILSIISMIVKFNLIWMVAADALNAFNRVPINRRFVKYFGIQIGTFTFFWTCLTFGGASSCSIYTWFASMIVWILVHWNQHLFMIGDEVILKQYLDDFITGSSCYYTAWCQYFAILIWFKILGIPTQEKKMVKPSRIIKYIGYILNLIRMVLMIPLDKLAKTVVIGESLIEKIDKKQKLDVLEMQSFVGIARFLTPVHYYLIPYLRNIEEAYRGKDPGDKVWGSLDIKKDIECVIKVILDTGKNSISFKWLLYDKSKGDIITETDASGNIGMGGFEKVHNGYCYKVRYSDISGWDAENQPDIVHKELMAVWIMHRLCRHKWKGLAIKNRCDNKAVVHMMIKKRSCFERKDCQDLIRNVCETSMISNYYHWYEWISTKENVWADALSRYNLKIIKKIPFKLINKDKEALILAAEGLKLYKESRKRMVRCLGDEKRCNCFDREICDDQPLYEKWRKKDNLYL